MQHNKAKRKRVLRRVLRQTRFFETLGVYFIVFFALAYLIFRREDVFETYGNALWYCFELVKTIGFGEAVAVTPVGRLLSIILSMYSIGMIAIITSTVVTYHRAKLRTMEEDKLELMMDKLERLPELSSEELKEISESVRRFRSS